MSFLAPWGLLGLAALLPVIALYFLKLKREERVVPSTLLWKKVLDDLQVNSPFQRLKYSLLLLAQLLLIGLLAFALARPYLSAAKYAARKTILLLDTSASMSTCDAGPRKDEPRLDVAVREATAKVGDMQASDEMMVMAFDRDVRQLSKFASDRGLLRQVLSGLQTRDLETRANEAFETAAALCEGDKDIRVLVLSDGCFGHLKLSSEEGAAAKGNLEDQGGSGGPLTPQERLARRLSNFRFVSYGEETSDNAAITQIEARSRPAKGTDENGQRYDTLETQVFVMVENFAPNTRDIVLSLAVNERRFAPKVIHLQGRPRRAESLEDTAASGTTSEAARSVEVFKLPLGATGIVTAHIEAPKDKLAVDDTAYCVIGTAEGLKLLLVTKGNYFLQKALGAIRGLTLSTSTPEDFAKQWDQKARQAEEAFDVCVFDGYAPLAWSEGGALFLGAMPPVSGFVKEAKPLEWPQVVDWDIAHPVMRYVNFGNVTVAEAQAWKVPKAAKVLVEGSGGPLVAALESDRMRVLGIAFDIFKSDWVYRPSLPLLLRNAVPWLAEASTRRRPTCQQTGDPLVIPPGLGSTEATLIRPAGGPPPEKIELSQEHSTFVKGTEKAGLYTLKDLTQERIYAANLASRTESDNAARGTIRIGEFTKPLESTRSAIEAKHEIWRDLALAACALLLLEWWVFHRRVGM